MAEKHYFIRTVNGQEGPYPLSELPSHDLRPETWVWCKGMPDWQRAREVADICRLYRLRLSDRMHPVQVESPALISQDTKTGGLINSSSRFSRFLQEGEELPPPGQQVYNLNQAPSNWILPAIIAIFFCPPLGAAALYYAIKSRIKWKAAADDNDRELAHDFCRRAKMLSLISFCVALIFCSYVAMKG